MNDCGLYLLPSAGAAEAVTCVGAGAIPFEVVTYELWAWVKLLKLCLPMAEGGSVDTRWRTNTIAAMRQVIGDIETLTDMLMTAGGVERGTLPCQATDFDVMRAVRTAIRRVHARSGSRGAEIEMWPVHPGRQVHADRSHVEYVLATVLDNALRYSGWPARVQVEVRDTEPVQVAVHDEGAGIRPEDQAMVFDPFRRLGSGSPSHGWRMGLGLFTARQFAEVNGGSLVLEHSAPGEGSVFVLRLPSASSRRGS